MKLTLAVGMALVVVVAALTLSHAPPRVVSLGLPLTAELAKTKSSGIGTSDLDVCQEHEVLPAGVSAIRLSLWAFIGYRVHLMLYSGSKALTGGERRADWTSNSVTVPIKPIQRTVSPVTLCVAVGANSEPLNILGSETPPSRAAVLYKSANPSPRGVGRGNLLSGRVSVEYLASGEGSWWSRATSVAQHVGLGRGVSGTWIAYAIAILMALVVVLALRLTIGEVR